MQQRAFDALPPHPGEMSLHDLQAALGFTLESVQEAVKNLRFRNVVEFAPGHARGIYRRVAGAERPQDRRIGNRNKLGKRKGTQ